MTTLDTNRALSPTELAKVYPSGCELQIAYKSRFGIGQLSSQAMRDAADGERVHREFEQKAARFMPLQTTTARASDPDNTASLPRQTAARGHVLPMLIGGLLLLVALFCGN